MVHNGVLYGMNHYTVWYCMIINLRKNETFELQVETFFKTTNIMFWNRLELIIENRKITIFRNFPQFDFGIAISQLNTIWFSAYFTTLLHVFHLWFQKKLPELKSFSFPFQAFVVCICPNETDWTRLIQSKTDYFFISFR